MGKIIPVLPVKLIVGLISKDPSLFKKASSVLIRKFGSNDTQSPIFDFNLTDYYKKEMGTDLKRQFISFERLIPAQDLPKIKLYTNKLEHKLSCNRNKRDINIDPGYISLSKLVLATTKSFVHRIYVKNGIFEEVTLFYKDHTFCPGPWTYPDYKTQSHISLFNEIRDKYYKELEKKYGISQLYRCV